MKPKRLTKAIVLALALGVVPNFAGIRGYAADPAGPAESEPVDDAGPAGEDDAEMLGSHVEVDSIRVPLGNRGKIKTMAMDRDGNLLLAIAWVPEGATPREREPEKAAAADEPPKDEKDDEADKPLSMEEIRKLPPEERRREMMKMRSRPGGGGSPGGKGGASVDAYEGLYQFAVRVVSPDGEVIDSLAMEDGLEPVTMYAAADGVLYIAGGGKLAAYRDGKQIKMIDTREIAGDMNLVSGLTVDEDPSGKQQIFVAFGTGRSTRATENVVRFDRGFVNPKTIIDEQFGCCGHLDMEVRDGELLVAENSRHRVNRYTFDGELIGRWGERDRNSIEGFAACCNPCNTDFGSDGILYTAESGVGRVKKFSREGEFLGFVGYVDTTEFDSGSGLAAQSCYIPIEVAPDGERIYVMDVRDYIVRVLEKRPEDSAEVAAAR